MEQLIELLEQIQDLAGTAIDALKGAMDDSKGNPDGEKPPGEKPPGEKPPGEKPPGDGPAPEGGPEGGPPPEDKKY